MNAQERIDNVLNRKKPYTYVRGDMRTQLRLLPPNSIDAIVTDPPYGLSFMGKGWDRGVPDISFWRECKRVLKPGGYLLSFGGTRTSHRIACNIEDAGFEIRDTISWMYGSGFPKSHDVSKAFDKMAGVKERPIVGEKRGADRLRSQTINGERDNGDTWGKEIGRDPFIREPVSDLAKKWNGWGTALKPAFEPIVVAQNPMIDPNIASSIKAYGVGGLNIDGCRISANDGYQDQWDKPVSSNIGNTFVASTTNTSQQKTVDISANKPSGRWPANVILQHDEGCKCVGTKNGKPYTINRFKDGAKPFGNAKGCNYETTQPIKSTEEIWECVPDCPIRLMDEQSGIGKSPQTGSFKRVRTSKGLKGGGFGQERAYTREKLDMPKIGHDDTGGASRFFYTSKTNVHERSDGLRAHKMLNNHPTVKPIDLMRYLTRLVTPPSGIVLDPFCGSGSTGCAAMLEGFRFIGVDLDEDENVETLKIARLRTKHWFSKAQSKGTW